MPRIHSILFTFAGPLVLALLTGCGGPVTPPSPSIAASPPATAPSTPVAAPKASCCTGDADEHTATETADAGGEDTAGLAQLSPEDRIAAKRQGVCPVEGGKLGSMGKPVKTTVNGRTVILTGLPIGTQLSALDGHTPWRSAAMRSSGESCLAGRRVLAALALVFSVRSGRWRGRWTLA